MFVPGWMTPEEAMKAIEVGFAPRLSAVIEGNAIAVAPSVVGNEGRPTPHRPGWCTFLTEDRLCEIHDSGFKPIECRTGFGCRMDHPDMPSVEDMHDMWNTSEGADAVAAWTVANSESKIK
jgi:hypothetical protein